MKIFPSFFSHIYRRSSPTTMSKPVVEPFESGANRRAVGTISGRDVGAMRAQLLELEKRIASVAARQDVVPKIYPQLPTPSRESADPKPLPQAPAIPPAQVAPAQNPDAELNAIIKMIGTITAQAAALIDEPPKCVCDPYASNPCANDARATTHIRQASFSRTLPTARETKTPKESSTAHTLGARGIKPEIMIASDEERQAAHSALDSSVDKGYAERAADLVIMSADELYCVQRFRAMVAERQGEVAKNFIHRFEKLCKRS